MSSPQHLEFLSANGIAHLGIVTEDASVATAVFSKPRDLVNKAGASQDCDVTTDLAVPAGKEASAEAVVHHPQRDDAALGASPRAEKEAPAPYTWRDVFSPRFWQRRVPAYVWTSLLVLLVLLALSLTGSIYYSRSIREQNRRAAADVAKTSARAIEKLLDMLIAPMMSLANYISVTPDWPTLAANFDAFALAVYKTSPYYQIEACPYGVVAAMATPWLNLTGAELLEFYKGFDYNVDLLARDRWDWDVNIRSINQSINRVDGSSNHSVILLGPWYADGELSEGAFVVRYNVFLPPGNWTKGMPPSSIHTCPADVCNTPDGLAWWGWSNAVFAWRTVSAELVNLEGRNLRYTLAPDISAANQSYLARTNVLPNAAECEHVKVHVFKWMSWDLCVAPPDGWGPSWRPGLIAGTSMLAVVLAGLTLLVLRSRQQAVEYLQRQLELNRELAIAKEEVEERKRVIEEEKKVMDALLQRQHDLIALFGREGGSTGTQDVATPGSEVQGGSGVSSNCRETATMDRIEAVRRQIAGRTQRSSASDGNAAGGGGDIRTMELLGEGTFGKVYRGLWRGTTVAVKTMVLPANMSGAEKREKMAVMEAAIASSLAHPNIVQTFTYSIRAVREEEDEAAAAVNRTGIVTQDASTCEDRNATLMIPGQRPSNRSNAESTKAVHAYEVRLVLEYCDRGCLRDALNGRAYFSQRQPSTLGPPPLSAQYGSDGGAATTASAPVGTLSGNGGGAVGSLMVVHAVDYRGVLDTAADIAKAMLHLHLANVLHGDLKARNVMLKSSGTEGRGVVCKVSDFGLAVKMDTQEQTHMSGMFQVLLAGRMSKAADVYAFGITMWELYTGGHAFQGVPRALLGHQITVERRRPAFPPGVPAAFEQLVIECWAHSPDARPSFENILKRLTAMREELHGVAAPLGEYSIGAPDVPEGAGALAQQAPAALLAAAAQGMPTSNFSIAMDALFKLGQEGTCNSSGSTGAGLFMVGSMAGSMTGRSTDVANAWDAANAWSGTTRVNARPALAVVAEEDHEPLDASTYGDSHPAATTGAAAADVMAAESRPQGPGEARGAAELESSGGLPQIGGNVLFYGGGGDNGPRVLQG